MPTRVRNSGPRPSVRQDISTEAVDRGERLPWMANGSTASAVRANSFAPRSPTARSFGAVRWWIWVAGRRTGVTPSLSWWTGTRLFAPQAAPKAPSRRWTRRRAKSSGNRRNLLIRPTILPPSSRSKTAHGNTFNSPCSTWRVFRPMTANSSGNRRFQGEPLSFPRPFSSTAVSMCYGAGCKLVKLGADNQVSEVYANQAMKNHHGGVVLVGDYLYGYSDDRGWLCQEFKSGKEVWSERNALGKGALSSADGMLYCLDENSGTVVLAEASPKGWKEHGRFKLDQQSKIRDSQGRFWTHPVISNGKLYLRDQDLIFCYDVKKS